MRKLHSEVHSSGCNAISHVLGCFINSDILKPRGYGRTSMGYLHFIWSPLIPPISRQLGWNLILLMWLFGFQVTHVLIQYEQSSFTTHAMYALGLRWICIDFHLVAQNQEGQISVQKSRTIYGSIKVGTQFKQNDTSSINLGRLFIISKTFCTKIQCLLLFCAMFGCERLKMCVWPEQIQMWHNCFVADFRRWFHDNRETTYACKRKMRTVNFAEAFEVQFVLHLFHFVILHTQ